VLRDKLFELGNPGADGSAPPGHLLAKALEPLDSFRGKQPRSD
jgi:hypothetical protein